MNPKTMLVVWIIAELLFITIAVVLAWGGHDNTLLWVLAVYAVTQQINYKLELKE